MPYLKQGPSWDELYSKVAKLAKERKEWAGLPMPVKGLSMTIHPSYPFADDFAKVFDPEPQTRVCRTKDVDESTQRRNYFLSVIYGCYVSIWRDSKGSFVTYSRKTNGAIVLNTLMASHAWQLETEETAMKTLRSLVTERAYESYQTTGSFIETSKRSQVSYIFRRLRPTVAMSFRPDWKRGNVGARILCTLCSHPIGLYNDSWAGAMCPTDDVISHLLLMRSDEHYFWRISNQHPAWAPESGL